MAYKPLRMDKIELIKDYHKNGSSSIVGGLGINHRKSVQEKFYIPDTTKLSSKGFNFGIEGFC